MSARLCKYSCGKELTSNTAKSMYYESDGTAHTPSRCKSLQKPEAAPTTENHKPNEMAKMHEENMVANRLLVAAINRLAAALEARK